MINYHIIECIIKASFTIYLQLHIKYLQLHINLLPWLREKVWQVISSVPVVVAFEAAEARDGAEEEEARDG